MRQRFSLAATLPALALALFCLLPGRARAAQVAGPTTIECGEAPSKLISAPLTNYCVALPADYATSRVRYPVMYFLHGLFEDERRWEARGGKEMLDGLLAKGEVGPFIVVLPNAGRTFYVNSFDGKVRYEDYFIQELVPFIDQKYRTLPGPANHGIFGISMGGYGALHLAMKHPELFGSVSAQSAALLPKFPDPLPSEGRWGFYARVVQEPFGSPLNEAYFDAQNPLTLAEHPENFAGLKIYFDCGREDRYGFNEGNSMLDQILTSKQFPHQFALREGGHGWDYEGQYMQDALLFEWQGFAPAAKPAAGGAHGRAK